MPRRWPVAPGLDEESGMTDRKKKGAADARDDTLSDDDTTIGHAGKS